jgi:hypothetical protein
MAESPPVQAPIIDRLDRAIARIVEAGHRPVCIFLTPEDQEQLEQYETLKWNEATGSSAYVWPTSYRDVPLYSEKLIEKLEVPVRKSLPAPRRSAVYREDGVGVAVNLP